MWNFNKMLGISGIEIIDFKQSKDKIYFQIRVRRKFVVCPTCGIKTDRLKSRSPLKSVRNGTLLGKLCFLEISLRRFQCTNCQKTFTEEFSGIKPRQRVTPGHKREVITNLSTQSFSEGSKKYKISYHTQRRWLTELIEHEVLNFNEEEKENEKFVLGIDEVSFAGRDMLTTVGNITKHRLKGVLNSRRKDELKRILRSLSPTVKSLITEAVIDMCDLYRTTVEEVLPNVQIVADHFHIVADANKRIDKERLLLQDIYKKRIPRYILTKNKEDLIGQQIHYLADIIKEYPELHMFYATKERIREMYRSSSKQEAEKQLRFVISTLESTDDGELISWGRTLSRWKTPILNYWNSRSTNGFMEGMHNKMKLIKRISFGFRNRRVFIYKVMLSVLLATVLLHT